MNAVYAFQQISTQDGLSSSVRCLVVSHDKGSQSNGGIAPTFNVIQMNYSNLHKLLGGSLHYKKEDSEKKTVRASAMSFHRGFR